MWRVVFEQIKKPSTTVFNQMIKGWGSSSTPVKAVEICKRMGVEVDGYQFHWMVLVNGYCDNVFVGTNLVNTYAVVCGDEGLKSVRRVFDEMPERGIVTWNTLVAGYVRCLDFEGAGKVFGEMPERNTVSWTIMISGLAQNGRCLEALSLFRGMIREGVGFDEVTLVAAFCKVASMGEMQRRRADGVRVERGR